MSGTFAAWSFTLLNKLAFFRFFGQKITFKKLWRRNWCSLFWFWPFFQRDHGFDFGHRWFYRPWHWSSLEIWCLHSRWRLYRLSLKITEIAFFGHGHGTWLLNFYHIWGIHRWFNFLGKLNHFCHFLLWSFADNSGFFSLWWCYEFGFFFLEFFSFEFGLFFPLFKIVLFLLHFNFFGIFDDFSLFDYDNVFFCRIYQPLKLTFFLDIILLHLFHNFNNLFLLFNQWLCRKFRLCSFLDRFLPLWWKSGISSQWYFSVDD